MATFHRVFCLYFFAIPWKPLMSSFPSFDIPFYSVLLPLPTCCVIFFKVNYLYFQHCTHSISSVGFILSVHLSIRIIIPRLPTFPSSYPLSLSTTVSPFLPCSLLHSCPPSLTPYLLVNFPPSILFIFHPSIPSFI